MDTVSMMQNNKKRVDLEDRSVVGEGIPQGCMLFIVVKVTGLCREQMRVMKSEKWELELHGSGLVVIYGCQENVLDTFQPIKKNAIFYITAIYLILKWDGKASSERIDFFSKCF